MKKLKFSNGDTMDAIGLGTWKAKGEQVKNAVKMAVAAGMRHIDTAAIYGNEVEIGEAIAELIEAGAVTREELFVTSKLWNDAHKAEDVTPAVQESLRKLQLDYLDLYLIHWPVAFQPGIMMPSSSEEYLPLSEAPLHTTWKAMEQVKDAGYARHIGVSNFSKKKLQDLIPKSRYVPEVNQVEMHPLLQQNELVDYCKDHGIRVTAYSPLGSGDRPPTMKGENEPTLMEIPEIKAIAGKHGVSPAQVLINWHTQRDVAVIPKSTSQHNIEANYKASNVPLNADDMQVISGLDRNFRFITGTFFDAPDKGYSNVYDE